MLRMSKGKYLFKSELLLEEFVWLHLQTLLDLKPIKRQYTINKQNRSDILGMTNEGRLALLELKKEGGKDSINQLLRYEKFLKQEQPKDDKFAQVDFNKNFLKIAIASHFNQATIDYAKQVIPEGMLLTYEVKLNNKGEYSLIFKKLDDTILSKIKIDIIEDELFESLPYFIQGYLLDNPSVREPILSIIQKILSFNPNMSMEAQHHSADVKELFFAKFGKDGYALKGKELGTFYYYPEIENPNERLVLFLEFPAFEFRRGKDPLKGITSVQVYTDDFINVNKLEDFYTKIHAYNHSYPLRYRLKTEGIDQTYNNWQDYYINYRKYKKSRQKLKQIEPSDFTLVESLVQMALDDWSVR